MSKRFVIADVDGDVLKLELSRTLLKRSLLVMGVCTDESGLIAQLNFDIEDVPTTLRRWEFSTVRARRSTMREIKFRGKDCWGNWRYGDLMKNSIPTASPVIVENFYYDDPDDSMFEVNPDTVGQYTGIKDAKGNEIYEGDIIRYKGENGRVYYENDCFGVAFYDDYATLLIVCDECEVIGNVHDNPELLEQN